MPILLPYFYSLWHSVYMGRKYGNWIICLFEVVMIPLTFTGLDYQTITYWCLFTCSCLPTDIMKTHYNQQLNYNVTLSIEWRFLQILVSSFNCVCKSMSAFIFKVNTLLEHYAFICHLQHTWTSILRWRPPHTVCAILQTINWQQSGDLYVLLLWNRQIYRSLYTTKQATEFINLHCQHRVFQSKECWIHV